jgi:hypothetical protein
MVVEDRSCQPFQDIERSIPANRRSMRVNAACMNAYISPDRFASFDRDCSAAPSAKKFSRRLSINRLLVRLIRMATLNIDPLPMIADLDRRWAFVQG